MSRTHPFVAFAAGACVSAATTGASSALTSMPVWTMLATGALLAFCAIHKLRGGDRLNASMTSASIASFVSGATFALALPTSAPPAPGAVTTHLIVRTMRGDLFDALAVLDSDPDALLGRTLSVTGTWRSAVDDGGSPTVSRRIASCCAADAVDVGFDVHLERVVRIDPGTWVRVEGVVAERVVDGDLRYVLEHSRIRGLEDDAPTVH